MILGGLYLLKYSCIMQFPKVYIFSATQSLFFIIHTQTVANNTCYGRDKKYNAFFSGVGTEPVHTQTKAKK